MSDRPLVRLTIDGRAVEVPRGTTILEAARSAGIEIPHFCYHPGIGAEGSCRLCLVEVVGAPKLVISCATEAMNGASVLTQSPPVIEARRAVLEFLLLNHPLDCPFCDKGGECPLQNYTYAHRQGHSRFAFPKRRGVKHRVIGEQIIFDSERCILCSRCVRFLRDIAGREELFLEERGDRCRIALLPGRQLSTGFSGNLADICPVGALTSRDFRFRARPWEMRAVPSTCGACALQCSIQHWVKKNEYLRTTPRIDPHVNGHWLCDAGRNAHQRWLSPARLRQPQRLEGKAWRPLSFAAAYAALQERLAEAASIYIYPSAQQSNEELALLYLLARRQPKVRLALPEGLPRFFAQYQELRRRNLLPGSMREFLAAPQILLLGLDPQPLYPVLALLLRHYHQQRRGRITLAAEAAEHWKPWAEVVPRNGGAEGAALLGRIPAEEGVAVLWGSRAAGEKAFAALLQQLDRRGGEAVVALGGEWVNGAGWSELEARYPGLSVPQAEALAAGEGSLHYLVCGEGEALPHPRGGTVVAESAAGLAPGAAELLFPWESPLEKTGSYINGLGKVQKLTRGVAAIEATHQGIGHLLRLAALCGAPLEVCGAEEIYRATLGQVAGLPGDYAGIVDESTLYEHYANSDKKHQDATAQAADLF